MLELAYNIISLGDYVVLVFIIILCIMILTLNKQYQKAAVTLAAIFIVCMIIEFCKLVFNKSSASFTMSIFLILAISSTNVTKIKRFLIFYALLCAIFIGLSKVYVGIVSRFDIFIDWSIGILYGIIYYYLIRDIEANSPVDHD